MIVATAAPFFLFAETTAADWTQPSSRKKQSSAETAHGFGNANFEAHLDRLEKEEVSQKDENIKLPNSNEPKISFHANTKE